MNELSAFDVAERIEIQTSGQRGLPLSFQLLLPSGAAMTNKESDAGGMPEQTVITKEKYEAQQFAAHLLSR
jgi:hypothetical protein